MSSRRHLGDLRSDELFISSESLTVPSELDFVDRVGHLTGEGPPDVLSGVTADDVENHTDNGDYDEGYADVLDDGLAALAVTQPRPSSLNADLESEQGVVVHVDVPLCFVMS